MFKSIVVASALMAAPAVAHDNNQITNALMVIVRIETANQFCGVKPDVELLTAAVNIVSPHISTTPQEFVDSVRRAAGQVGSEHVKNGTLGPFCANWAVGVMK